MMCRKLISIIFLIFGMNFSGHTHNTNMVSINVKNDIYEQRLAFICSLKDFDDASTWGTQRCIEAVLSDSRKELKSAIERLENYISDFTAPTNAGKANRQGYLEAFNDSQKKWEEYVKKQCSLVVYELASPSADFTYSGCLAKENYYRAQELSFY